MPRLQAILHDVRYLPHTPQDASFLWKAARKYFIDLIPFLSMVALLAFIILDNARG